MNQKERLERIRQQHLKERRKKRIFINRIIFAAGVAAVFFVIILLISKCTAFISDKNEEVSQPSPEPVAEETMSPTEISMKYYENSVFIGNSFIEGMLIYDLVDGADYFSKIGLDVSDAMEQSTETGTVPVIDELNSEKKYNKIFMMFGENELGWIDSDTFVLQYGKLIDKTKQYQSESKIYLMAVTPVTKKVSDKNVENTNNDRIREYNSCIKQLAEDKGVIYADIYNAVADETGALPEGAASDGIHFGEEYYKKCLLYIQNQVKEG